MGEEILQSHVKIYSTKCLLGINFTVSFETPI